MILDDVIEFGSPLLKVGLAMADYIEKAIAAAREGKDEEAYAHFQAAAQLYRDGAAGADAALDAVDAKGKALVAARLAKETPPVEP